jgi:hypothetical protein
VRVLGGALESGLCDRPASGFFQVFEKSRQILKKASKFFEKGQPAARPATRPAFFKILLIVPTLVRIC